MKSNQIEKIDLRFVNQCIGGRWKPIDRTTQIVNKLNELIDVLNEFGVSKTKRSSRKPLQKVRPTK